MVDLVAACSGAHTERFDSAVSLGICGFLMGLHTLAKMTLALLDMTEGLLVWDLPGTVALGEAMFVGKAVDFGG